MAWNRTSSIPSYAGNCTAPSECSGPVTSAQKPSHCPPGSSDQCQDAERGDHAAVGKPQRQQEAHDSSYRCILVFYQQPEFLPGVFARNVSAIDMCMPEPLPCQSALCDFASSLVALELPIGTASGPVGIDEDLSRKELGTER